MAKSNYVVTLHVQLEGIEPHIWRKIAVDGDITLRALHHIIQAAFGWTDAHLHEFIVGERTYSMLDNENVLDTFDDPDEELFDDRKAKLLRIAYTGLRFEYHYDFGDSWRHLIVVEKMEERNAKMGRAWVTDGARAVPPEDVGGIPGYEQFLDTLRNEPDSEEARELRTWAGGPFDPEAFDRRIANAALLRMAWNGWGKK